MVVDNLTEKDDMIGKMVKKDFRGRKEGCIIVDKNKREAHDGLRSEKLKFQMT